MRTIRHKTNTQNKNPNHPRNAQHTHSRPARSVQHRDKCVTQHTTHNHHTHTHTQYRMGPFISSTYHPTRQLRQVRPGDHFPPLKMHIHIREKVRRVVASQRPPTAPLATHFVARHAAATAASAASAADAATSKFAVDRVSSQTSH